MTGNPVYTPNPDFNGTDSFTYTIDDGNGATDTATVTVTINPVNDGPNAIDDVLTTPEDTPVYTPEANFVGTDTFSYTITDGSGETDSAVVEVSVVSVNAAPDAIDDSATTEKNAAVNIAVRANDVDPDGDPLSVVAVINGLNGTVSVDPATGNPVYTPRADFVGEDFFFYTISDGNGATDTAAVKVTVTEPGEGPVANPDSASTTEESPVTIDVLANDTDPDGFALTVSGIEVGGGMVVPETGQPVTLDSGATVVLQGDGTLLYTPAPDANALAEGETLVDSFVYEVDNQNEGITTGTVEVEVTGEDDPLVSNPDNAVTDKNSSVTIDVLSNDGDPDDGVFVGFVSPPPFGQGTAINDGGTGVIFDPGLDFQDLGSGETELVSFTYEVENGRGETAVETITVTVTGDLATPPVVIDLDGDGVEFDPVAEGVSLDVDGDGQRERTAWADEDDGVLIYDADNDGEIDGREEFVFADYGESADATDLEGLRAHFDSDADGRLTARDEEFGQFRIWQDKDGDGAVDPGEWTSLRDAGIESIGLVSDGRERWAADGDVRVHGESEVSWSDGTAGIAADASFRFEEILDSESEGFEAWTRSGDVIDLNEEGGRHEDTLDPADLAPAGDHEIETRPMVGATAESGGAISPTSLEEDAAEAHSQR